jgi:hexosaminidase
MMWAEKLLNAFNKGTPIGGAGHGEGYKHVPALYPCRDLLPRDIIMLHWYNVFNHQYDRVYHDRGYETFYGNLRAINVEHWNVRTEWGIKGGFVSNWGSFDEEYMQRNQQYCNLISTAYAFWCKDFESLGREKQIDLTMKEAHRLKKSKIKNPLTLTHTTDYKIDFKYFYDGIFIDDETYMLGSYKISYSDGSFALIPVKYGLNVGRSHYDDYLHEVAFTELSYSTLPVRYKDGWAYKCVYENPEPNKKITGIVYQPCENKEDINVELISFAAEFEVGNVSSGESHSADEEFAWDGE